MINKPNGSESYGWSVRRVNLRIQYIREWQARSQGLLSKVTHTSEVKILILNEAPFNLCDTLFTSLHHRKKNHQHQQHTSGLRCNNKLTTHFTSITNEPASSFFGHPHRRLAQSPRLPRPPFLLQLLPVACC